MFVPSKGCGNGRDVLAIWVWKFYDLVGNSGRSDSGGFMIGQGKDRKKYGISSPLTNETNY